MDTIARELRYQTVGTIWYDPPDDARATSALVTIYTPSGVEHVAQQAATVDAVNTTLDGAHAEAAESLTLTAVTGVVVGRRYLLIHPDGPTEWVRVLAVDTATKTATLAEGLRRAYDTGSAFVGLRLSVALTSGQTDPLDEGYRADWVRVVGGVTLYASTVYDVVRYPWPARVIETHELRDHLASLGGLELQLDRRRGLAFADEIEQAQEMIRADIRERGHAPGRFVWSEPFGRPIALRIVLEWALSGQSVPRLWQSDVGRWVDECRTRYEQALTQALDVARTYDEDESGAVDDSERETSLGVLRIRL